MTDERVDYRRDLLGRSDIQRWSRDMDRMVAVQMRRQLRNMTLALLWIGGELTVIAAALALILMHLTEIKR